MLLSLQSLLQKYHTAFTEEAYFRYAALAFLQQYPDRCTDRTLTAGHFTASAWVLHPDGMRALLIHHKGLGKWFQPGGHVEATDANLEAAARREVAEECGLTALEWVGNGIFDLDIHLIPAKGDMPEHPHYDVRFCYRAATAAVRGQATEIHDWEWVPLLDLLAPNVSQSLRRMAQKINPSGGL